MQFLIQIDEEYKPTDADWREFDTWCRRQDEAREFEMREEGHV